MLLLSTLPPASPAQPEPLKSRAESTDYEETSRYEDVVRFFNELQQRSQFMRFATFGHSQEGRALPLVILSDPPLSQPREARASGKPVVFIMANIHAGEVEGKEAVQHIARRILTGDLRPLLGQLIILIAPIYNADGNERISLTNRIEQNGPIGGVGERENAQGLDLNRDFIKLEAPETQSLLRLFNRWDPHLTVDLHTTDGSHHGYHLTYSMPLNPSLDPKLLAYHRDKLIPSLASAMSARHKFRTYYYGNFSGPEPEPGAHDLRTWRAFSPQPRIGQNYAGFRNRLAILSEAYSYLDFRGRVEATTAFVEEILQYAAAHGAEIRGLTQEADREATRRGLTDPRPQLGVEYEPKALPRPVPVLVGEVMLVKNPRSGREMTVMVPNKIRPVKMLDYGMFAAKRSVPLARAYLFHREAGLRVVIDKLLAHGVAVEELTAPLTADAESFVIQNVTRAGRAFERHNQVKLSGQYKSEPMAFPEGTILVRASQPLGKLAACLLEPESDDGLVTWNFLDPYLGPGKIYPITKLMQDVKLASRLVEQ
jgi:hypothetical protein